ncbi:MAG: energy transducer TonB [Deltaproteobacteria bacterium]|nr:energy transducer TonB [Deltaproteobacteria bacterium]
MRYPLFLSLILHGTLLGVLLGAPVKVAAPEKRAVSLVTVDVVAAKASEPVEAAEVELRDRPPVKKGRGTRDEGRGTKDEGRTTVEGRQETTNAGTPAADAVVGTGEAGGMLLAAIGGGTASPAASSQHVEPGGAKGSAGNLSNAYNAIRESIERAARKSYPLRARKLGIQGVAIVRFAVGPDGSAKDIVVLAGSGHEILDQAARSIVAGAGPYPSVPEPVQIPIRFSLEN